MNYTDIDYINGIRANDEKILHDLYRRYFKMVRHYVITNSGDESDAKDIYHETLMALMNAVQKEHFILNASLSTLIYAICKRLWLKHLNKHKHIYHSEDLYHKNFGQEQDDAEAILEEHFQKEQNIHKIKKALQSIGNPCYDLLKEFYFNKTSMEQIAQKLGYNNADVAKNQKYKCLQRLKKYFFEQETEHQSININLPGYET